MAVAGPERSGSGTGVPVPSSTILVRVTCPNGGWLAGCWGEVGGRLECLELLAITVLPATKALGGRAWPIPIRTRQAIPLPIKLNRGPWMDIRFPPYMGLPTNPFSFTRLERGVRRDGSIEW